MTIPKTIANFLKASKAKYEIINHRTVYTAYDKAVTLRLKPGMVGKTLLLRADKDIVLVLIPANKNLDKNKFKKAINDWRRKTGQKLVKNTDFLSEKSMKNKLRGVKIGAVSPLGKLWKLPTFVEKSLIIQPKIIINGGEYDCSIKISSSSFRKLIPDLIVGRFSKNK